ncbi:MAG: HTTM domain-containing protein [Ferruginibacter sp.]
MMASTIKYYIHLLQQENYKSFYLAFLRVAVSCWLLKEVCINWQSMDLLYGDAVFVVAKNNLLNRLPGGQAWVSDHYIWFIVLYMLIIFLNILGIGRWFTALLLFLFVYVLQQMNRSFLNGGDIMARLVLLYMVFANSYQYFVLVRQKKIDDDQQRFNNLLSNMAALSIMLQLCVAYFGLGLAKLNSELWRNGEATYYALQMERFIGTPVNRYIVQYKWIDIASNYAVLLFELSFPLLIWVKKLRKPLLISGLLFHCCIYIFLMIYGFQVVFILIYGLFLPNNMWLKFYRGIIKN